jgi:hypothetical protein
VRKRGAERGRRERERERERDESEIKREREFTYHHSPPLVGHHNNHQLVEICP